MNNGWETNLSRIKSEVNQAYPQSPYLFILSAEILANEIVENKNRKGIQVNCKEMKISQDADDMILILDGNKDLQ